MAKNRLEIILSGQVRDFNAKLREARQEADDSFGAISSAAQSASVALGGVAIGGAALAKSFVDKAVEMQKFRATLIAVTKDVDVADESLRKMVQFASTTPFDLPGVVDAGVKLRSLQVDVDKFLPLAGDLAAVFQRDIRDSALALGRALSGSQEGVEVLNRSFGISKREMEAAGAVMKANGAVAIDSAKDLEKLEIALTNIIKQKYGGAMKEQSKDASVAFANLGDAIGQLQAALGSELTDDFASLARSITELVQEFNEIPGPTKRMIAQTVVFGTAVVGTAAAVSGLIAVFGPLAGVVSALAAKMAVGAAASSTAAAAMAATEAAAVGLAGGAGAATVATTGLTGAISAAGTALVGALAPALVVVAGGLIYLTNEQGKLNQVMEKSLEIEEKVAGFQRKQRQTILDTADAYRIYAGDVTRAGEALADAAHPHERCVRHRGENRYRAVSDPYERQVRQIRMLPSRSSLCAISSMRRRRLGTNVWLETSRAKS